MTLPTIAAAVLAASLAAEPATAGAAKGSAPTKAPIAQKAPKPSAPPSLEAPKLPASPEALADAVTSLLGPCSPEMAGGRVTSIEVLDGNQLNALNKKAKTVQAKAEPLQRFIKVGFEASGKKGTTIRQVSTQHMLTTEQAQKLLGEKLCVFQE